MISFLHTSKVHIDRFESLVRLHDQEVVTKHYVNAALLDTALSSGKTDSVSFGHQIEEIKKDNPSLIICTCSTYGEESDKDIAVYRIDRPIVEYLVKKYDRIGLAFTANSTKEISKNLLLSTSQKLKKEINIIDCDCSAYWPHFEEGNIAAYEKGIAANIEILTPKVDVIFLAQASMEGAKKHLTHLSKEVLSSPEYGMKELMATYKGYLQQDIDK